MALILPVKGIRPIFGEDCFLSPNATVVGDVIMGDRCSVWFNAVVRGDVNSIRIGDNVNIQDNVVIHCTYQKTATTIAGNVSIGHSALVHGCTVQEYVLIGMGAIILDRAEVHSYCIVAAGSVVLEGSVCASGYLYAGTPARNIKALTIEQREMLQTLPSNYIMYSSFFASDSD